MTFFPNSSAVTIFGYFNHEMDSGLEMFADFYYYSSKTNRINDSNIDLSAVPLRVGASNYYNPLGRAELSAGSRTRIACRTRPGQSTRTCPTKATNSTWTFIGLTNIRELPTTTVKPFVCVYGLRGTLGDWDWESAVTWSEATRDEVTHNRLSNTLITQALFDPTPAAYNPFSAGVDSNIERALIDVYRNGESALSMWDLKFSNPELFEMWAGPVGFLAGFEYRRESYKDDRDPRLDGTIRFLRESDPIGNPGVFDIEGDYEGDTYPFTSDVMRSSPTPDGKGNRTTNSLFVEFQVPLHETLDIQLAARYEDFDDIGDTTVGKIAFGWRPIDQLLFRGSWSEAFRAPNLITINEQFVARSNTLNDCVCLYGEDQGEARSDDAYGIQRQATGSKDLVPEESTNTSIGVVLQPTERLTVTLDFWKIEKDNTIGLFGEENHILYDLVLRTQAGTGGATSADLSACDGVQGNPLVQRVAYDPDDTDLIDGYLAAGLCPVGEVDFVADNYTNLDTRTLRGYDFGIYYNFELMIGEFDLRYNGSFYDEFKQTASSELSTAVLNGKAADPTITYPLRWARRSPRNQR